MPDAAADVRSLRVLVVEDSAPQAEAMRQILTQDGFEVVVASDGLEGLEALERAPFDLVVSDIQMPRMNGYELCSRIKQPGGKYAELPVILVTVLREPADIVRALECGADNFITKPFDRHQLVARIRAFLGGRSRRSGGELDISVMGHRVHIGPDNGQVLDFLLSTLEDLVRSKQREQELLMAEMEMDRRAAEALERHSAELARSNEELQEFAYVAAHDLQAPLRTVTLCTEWLASEFGDKLGPEAAEFIRHATGASRRMHKLIEDLLSYSRVGTRARDLEPTDANTVVDELLEDLSRSIHAKGGTVTRGPLPIVMADRTQLQQVFQNLIANAIKFSGDRPPEIRISAEQLDGESRFAVSDNGIGIEEQYCERIFVIFQRLHTEQEYPGTGLGLAICKKVVQRHGGRIWVRSEPGRGSTFYFTIPAAAGAMASRPLTVA